MEQWQAEMRRLKIEHFKGISKEFYRVNGGDNMTVRPYTDNTAAGFINCIVDYLGYCGYCTKVGTEVRGYVSIRTNINGQKILISVHVRKRKNRKGELFTTPHKPTAGEIHCVATDMSSFLQWFKLTFGSIQD